MANLLPDGTKIIKLSQEQFKTVSSALKAFYVKTKCEAIVIAEHSGMVIGQQGKMSKATMPLLSALAAADYAATNEMAKIIGESDGFKVHFHEGANNNIYIRGVGDSYFMVIVFDKNTTFGMIRVLAEKVAEEIDEAMSKSEEEPSGDNQEVATKVDGEDFKEELTARLDSVLGTGNK